LVIPEWDGVDVTLRGMTGAQRMDLVEQTEGKARKHFYADILIALAYDPDTGEPMFDPADRDWIMGKSGAVLERLGKEAVRISGVSVEDAEDAIEADPTSDGA